MSGNIPERFRTPRGGFTLVELLVVMGVITLLTALVVGVGMTLRAHAKEDAARLLIQKAERALDEYETRQGDYPDGLADPSGTQEDFRDANCVVGLILKDLDEFSRTRGGGRALEIFRIDVTAILPPGDGMTPGSVQEPPVTGSYFVYCVVDPWFNNQVDAHDLDLDATGSPPAIRYSFLNFAINGHTAPGVDIWSNGPNGLDDHGGGDDINNWSRR